MITTAMVFLATPAGMAVSALVTPPALQLGSWLVKKSPWLWDDTLWGWCTKNKVELKEAGRMIFKKKIK